MNMLFNLIGLSVIALIIWWFWIKKSSNEKQVQDNKPIEIIVDNGIYSPDTIRVKTGKPITLRFIRKAENPCAKIVMFTDLNISHELPINKPYDVQLTIDKSGTYPFTCEMAMYRGKIIAS